MCTYTQRLKGILNRCAIAYSQCNNVNSNIYAFIKTSDNYNKPLKLHYLENLKFNLFLLLYFRRTMF